MLIVIDKHSGVPIFRQIVEQVKHQILTGGLDEGAALTSVKDLSRDLRINPMTVSKAYGLLEMDGFLERRRGIGLFIRRPQQDLTKRTKRTLLEDALAKPVVQAVQMDVSEPEFLELARKLYRHYRPEGS